MARQPAEQAAEQAGGRPSKRKADESRCEEQERKAARAAGEGSTLCLDCRKNSYAKRCSHQLCRACCRARHHAAAETCADPNHNPSPNHNLFALGSRTLDARVRLGLSTAMGTDGMCVVYLGMCVTSLW